MSDTLAALFDQFDRGRLSRRQLLQALGVAVAARPASAFAQGQCGGARAGTPECDPTPAKLPFEPTGWKTVLLDHFSCQVADYPKEAAYYAALMNWKIRSDDGKQARARHRRLGRAAPSRRLSGATAPPPAAAGTAGGAIRRLAAAAAGAVAARAAHRRVRRLLLGHRAVGREESRSRAAEARAHAGRRQSRQGLPELPRQGSRRLRSADQQRQPEEPPPGRRRTARPRRRRRSRRPTGRPCGSITSRSRSSNYKETVAFYTALLGWKPGTDEGSQNTVRNRRRRRHHHPPRRRRRPGGGAGTPPPARRAAMGHIAFGITPFDPDQVKAELDKRGLNARVDTGGSGDIHTAPYKSYHTTTPNGFDLQISATTRANRAG